MLQWICYPQILNWWIQGKRQLFLDSSKTFLRKRYEIRRDIKKHCHKTYFPFVFKKVVCQNFNGDKNNSYTSFIIVYEHFSFEF